MKFCIFILSKNITTYIVFLFLSFQISSQTSEEIENKNENLVLIIKNDGGEYIREIISNDGRDITVVTKSIGKIYMNKSDISLISKVSEENNIQNEEFKATDPFTALYYFTTMHFL